MSKDTLSDDDKDLFRKQMKDVTPLKKAHQIPSEKKQPSIMKKTKIARSFEKKSLPEVFLSDYISEEVNSESTISYKAQVLANKQFSALRRGLIPWSKRLDLHGLKADEARDRLTHFIHECYEADIKSLLVIHGKGGQTGAPPVIKNLVNRWLPQFHQVLAYHSALAKDGGSGAVYVLLKSRKPI